MTEASNQENPDEAGRAAAPTKQTGKSLFYRCVGFIAHRPRLDGESGVTGSIGAESKGPFQSYVSFIAGGMSRFLQGSRADSLHIRDCMTAIAIWTLLLAGGALLTGVALALMQLEPAAPGGGELKIHPTPVLGRTAVLTLFGALVGYAVTNVLAVVDKAGKRLGLVDMVTSDILALCNVIDQMKLFEHYRELWRQVASGPVRGATKWPPRVPPKNAATLQARQEDYFEVWSKSIAELGALDREAIKRITRFYAYLKASRDATRALGLWKDGMPQEQWAESVESILVLLALCLRNARLALDSLLEDEDPERSVGFRFVVRANMKAHEVLLEVMQEPKIGTKEDRLKDLKLAFTASDYATFFNDDAWRTTMKGKMK